MNYTEAIDFVHSIPKFRRPLGNANLRRLLAGLGNPQDKLKFIHIAGTNGKGSTAAMTASVLAKSHYKTGLFTSPFIEVFNERIRINGEMILDGALTKYISLVKETMEHDGAPVSEFAFITAAAMKYFADMNCDFVVLEAGMGGRLDATNVIDRSEVSVITSIGLDHTEYLGGTVEEITLEKCGIIKEGGVVVSYPNSTAHLIEAECRKKHARFIEASAPKESDGGIIYKGERYPLGLRGEYQKNNAAVALEAISVLREKGVEIGYNAICDGLSSVKWQARFEFIGENIIIDGAHNIDGIRALVKSLAALDKEIVLVMAMMEDKAYAECIREICPIASKLIASEIDMPRCLLADKLADTARKTGIETVCEPDLKKAVDMAVSLAEDKTVCICGSLYFAGEARKILRNKFGLGC